MLGACTFGATLNARSVTGTRSRCNRSGIKHRRRADRVLVRVRTHRPPTGSRQVAALDIHRSGGTCGHEVAATISDLAPNSVTHYRICTEGSDGLASCSNDRTLTTGFTGRDTVSGSGTVLAIPELGYSISASANASSAARRRITAAGVRRYLAGRSLLPDSGHRDRHLPSCERQSRSCRVRALPGARPLVGDLIPRTVFIEDNGPTGDRIQFGGLASPYTTCPNPATATFPPFIVGGDIEIPPVLETGNFVVHDNAGASEAPSCGSDLALLELLVEVAGLAQRALQLAGGRLGQAGRRHQHDVLGRQADRLAHPLGHRGARTEVGVVGLVSATTTRPPCRAGRHPEGDDVAGTDAVELADGPLDVLGEDVAAADDDDVLDAPADHQLAVDEVGEVAGAQPAVVEQLGGGAGR